MKCLLIPKFHFASSNNPLPSANVIPWPTMRLSSSVLWVLPWKHRARLQRPTAEGTEVLAWNSDTLTICPVISLSFWQWLRGCVCKISQRGCFTVHNRIIHTNENLLFHLIFLFGSQTAFRCLQNCETYKEVTSWIHHSNYPFDTKEKKKPWASKVPSQRTTMCKQGEEAVNLDASY